MRRSVEAATAAAILLLGPDAGRAWAADALTWNGITVYGTVDLGVAHLSHGAPLSPDYGSALPFTIQKFNDRPTTSIVPNALGQSKLGVMGDEVLTGDVSAVFKLETGFQPTSLRLADGPRSLIRNNGAPLGQQTTAGDSSRAGQLFQGAADAGVASKRWGTLTFGWQPTLLADSIGRYDPLAQSQAFSVIGYTGFTVGAGTTESGRFANSLKYAVKVGRVRLGAMHQFGAKAAYPGDADQLDVGIDIAGFSADALYTHVDEAVSAASLNAAQAIAAPGTLAATVSDDTAYTLAARYVFGRAKLYAGYESIVFANPGQPLPPGFTGIAGYRFSVVNNTAYGLHRLQRVSWTGASYALTARLSMSAGYYRYDQNSYKGNGCADASASSCRGRLEEASVLADYRLSRHFDVYAGLGRSSVAGGLASGYLQTDTVNEAGGVRFSF